MRSFARIHPTHQHAVLLLMLATLFWSTSGLFIKLSAWNSLGLNGARSLLAAGVVWVGVGRPSIRLTKPLLLGALAYALTTITFTFATRLTTAANAVFLQFTAPVWVALLSTFLLGEAPRRRDWIMTAVILSGMLLFFQADLSPAGLWGNVIAIFSGICLAMMIIAVRAQRESGAAEMMVVGNLLAFFIGVSWIPTNPITAREVGIVIYLGVIQLGVPFLLLIVAIKSLTAVETIMIQCIEPILNPIWVALIIAEYPAPLALVGAAIVITAVCSNVLLE